MKVFVFTDLHGNIYALKNIIKSKDYKSADVKILLGDIITFSPFTNECVDLIRKQKDLIAILGNNDSYVVNGLTKDEEKVKNVLKLEHINNLRQELSTKNTNYLKSLPRDFVLKQNNIEIYFTHYLWETKTELVDDPKTYDMQDVYEIFKDVKHNIIVFGHLHKPFCYEIKNKKLVCVGSCGATYPSCYTMIEIKENQIVFENKNIDYSYKKLKNAFKKCNDKPRQELYKILDNEFLRKNK